MAETCADRPKRGRSAAMRLFRRTTSAGEEAASPRDGGSPVAARSVPSSPAAPTVTPPVLPPPAAAAPPSHFCCPISMELMSDPVILATGQSYHRASIVRWLEAGHKTCPSTGTRLRHLELVPNFALRSAIVVRARRGAWRRVWRERPLGLPFAGAGADRRAPGVRAALGVGGG